MLPRSGLDAICKKMLYLRPFRVLGSQSAFWYSKSSTFPVPPKRNRSAYLWYMKDILPTLKKEYPNFKNTELFAVAGDKWRNADKDTLLKYQQAAMKDKEQYLKALKNYHANLTPEIKSALEKSKAVEAKAKQKKQLKALGMPKKPLNAYILFFMDYAKKNIAEGSYVKEASKAGSVWASLSDSEKAKWNELAAAQEKDYRKKLEEWEAEMVAKGHLEVIHTKGKP